jgi:CheY-like chemotaxis protein
MDKHPVILVGEDDDNDVLLMQRAFKKAKSPHSLQIARDGCQVIDYLTGNSAYADRRRYPTPGLVLLDIKMPKRTGLEVLKFIRQCPALKRLPTIIFSSSRTESDIKTAYDLGANSYIGKPSDFEGLVNLLQILTQYWFFSNLVLPERANFQPGIEGGTAKLEGKTV